MGSSFLKNDEGRIIIDDNGYPVVAEGLKIIGDPNPDWTMGLDALFSYKYFDLELTLDLKKGGDIWNGTAATLNYLGLSKETGESRFSGTHIFNGVHADGSENITPVRFYDPDLSVEENRWIRYGEPGVASEVIEHGSWIRLSKLSLSYSLSSNLTGKINLSQIRFTIFTNNLFLITPYSGVDPQSRFLGFENNAGIDYFNTPGIKTIGGSIQIIL
jgi:hypothetical protein